MTPCTSSTSSTVSQFSGRMSEPWRINRMGWQKVNMLKRVWHDPVWSKVIASLIPIFAVSIGTYLLNLWPLIVKLFYSVIDISITKVSISSWIFALLPLLSVSFIVWLTVTLWKRVWLFCCDSSHPGIPIPHCHSLGISLFLQKSVAMMVEPWASLRIWPDDCVDIPVVRGNPSTCQNPH